MVVANATCLWNLARVFVAVVVAPEDTGATVTEMEWTYLRRFGQRAVYADDYLTPVGAAETCWDAACNAEPATHPCRPVSRKPRENPGFSDFGGLYLGRIPVDSAPS